MNNFVFFKFLCFALILIGGISAIPITTCQNISVAGQYTLSNNLTSPSYSCLNVTVANVEIDCQGYNISGALTNYGVFSTAGNTTVKNCNIYGFSMGIYTEGSADSTYQNLIITNVAHGLRLYNGANNNKLQNVSVIASTFGIYIFNSDNANISNTSIYSGTNNAILLQTTNNNIVSNSTFYANGVSHTIYLLNAGNTTISNSTATNVAPATAAVDFTASSGNFIIQNRLVHNTPLTESAISVASGDNNLIFRNNFSGKISNSIATTQFNTSSEGNIYYYANGSGIWTSGNGSSLQTPTPPNWSSTGYKVNLTNFPDVWSGIGNDSFAWTNNPITPTYNISTNATTPQFDANSYAHNAIINLSTSGFDINATMLFNGVNYTPTKTSTATQINFSITITPPIVNASTLYNISWTFQVAYPSGTLVQNTSNYTIQVQPSRLMACGGLTNTSSINYTFKDADTLSPVNATFSGIYTMTLNGIVTTNSFTNVNGSTCINPPQGNFSASALEVANASGYLTSNINRPAQFYNNNTIIREILLIPTSSGVANTFTVLLTTSGSPAVGYQVLNYKIVY